MGRFEDLDETGFFTTLFGALLTAIGVGAALAVAAATSLWLFGKVCGAISCL